ncbi:type II toxin-antitoxin system RelE/ParE family toxin [Paenibacillus filicis]|uniref:type II toxin-antitoxin system RelE/ParE family toxin n=1 Tax=Paenibacillus filicis TaxID=669464 RepID=UPI003BF953E9
MTYHKEAVKFIAKQEKAIQERIVQGLKGLLNIPPAGYIKLMKGYVGYEYLLLAFEEAEKARDEGSFPIGAVIVDSNGEIISQGRNRVFSSCDSS